MELVATLKQKLGKLVTTMSPLNKVLGGGGGGGGGRGVTARVLPMILQMWIFWAFYLLVYQHVGSITAFPVPSQMVVARTLRKNLMSVATKIAIQMNCKMGGVVWAVHIPVSRHTNRKYSLLPLVETLGFKQSLMCINTLACTGAHVHVYTQT